MGNRVIAIRLDRDIDCPYRAGQVRRVFAVSANGPKVTRADAQDIQNRFVPLGYSGMPMQVSTNECPSCQACVPLRLRATDYPYSRSERRVLAAAARAGLMGETLSPVLLTPQHHNLFRAYMAQRHPESAGDFADFREFEKTFSCHTHMMEIRTANGDLAGFTIFDALDNGLSAIQNIYDPTLSDCKSSLGTLAYLLLIHFAAMTGKEHIYIGSYVWDSPKLNYKSRFHALEAMTADGWAPFDPARHTKGPLLSAALPPDIPVVVMK